MPWDEESFARKHNKKLKGKKAKKAARVANAILRDTGDDGKAIRIANWMAKRTNKKKKKTRSD